MSIPYVRRMAFDYGVVDQVSPLIRRVVCDNPGPFTYLGTGTYIVGAGEVAVIDPGPLDDAHLAAIRKAVEGERVAAIVITHSHADHSPLAAPLAAHTGAVIYGRAESARLAAADSGEVADTAFRPDVEVEPGRRITGPDWTLEAIPTPGHAANHVAYALLEENALFSGDHVMGWSTTVVSPPDGDMDAYMASLDRVIAGGFATLWPTHGPPITDPAPFLDAYREHRLTREGQVLAHLAKGPSPIGDMVPRLYVGIDPRLRPAAARSLWAHLIRLVRRGAVTVEGEPELDSVYRLASPLAQPPAQPQE